MTTAAMTTTGAVMTTRYEITEDQIALIKRTICKGASDDELNMFVQTAKRLGLDPFARQIFAVQRWDSREGRNVMAIQVSIDGFRLTAERTGKYAGQLGPFWSADGKEWVEVWLDAKPPAAAKVGILRKDFSEPLWSVATWEQYKQEGKNGITPMWKRMGPLMLGKCCESLGLRRAFPNELSGVYSPEEMAQAETVDVTPARPAERYVPGGGPAQPPKAAAAAPASAAVGMAQTSPMASAKPAPANSFASTPASTMPTSAVPAESRTATGTAKLPRADQVPHDGTFATPGQVKLLHTLATKLEIACDGNCAVGGKKYSKTKGLVDVTHLCKYHTGVAAFKDCDGKKIASSKDLSERQISILIDRMQAGINRRENRSVQPIDLGPADDEPGPPPATLESAAADATKDPGELDDLVREVCATFNVDSFAEMDREASKLAYGLISAYHAGGRAGYCAARDRAGL